MRHVCRLSFGTPLARTFKQLANTLESGTITVKVELNWVRFEIDAWRVSSDKALF